MGTQISLGNPPMAITLRHSARARRMSLRVSRLDGTISLTVPKRTPQRAAMAFLEEREDWLRQNLSQVAPQQTPRFGHLFPFMGRDLRLHAAPVKRPMIEADTLILPEGEDQLAARLRALLKTQARDQLSRACNRHASRLGKPFGKLTLRDTRSRWGSCTHRGDLMFSWRLIMAPPHILDYVAAHEVAHLAHMDHSSAFWDTCETLFPDHKPARRWLRTEGNRLHAWQI